MIRMTPNISDEPAGEQRVEAAEQDALDDGVDPGHAAAPRRAQAEVRLGDLLARQLAARALEHDPSLEHADHAVGDRQRAREVLLDERRCVAPPSISASSER